MTMRVEPAGIDIEVSPGETLLQAAWRAGYDWPTLCYARGTCTACRCEVLDGLHLLSERTEAEVALLGDLDRRVRRANPRRIRLACQATASGHITVRKPGVKKQSTVEDQEAANVERQ
ncbi:ferredoxin [Mycolicibacterium vaccae ATCC 25954]|uniref:Ferredoxin n=2 Tax=Mycolicibacterium vaccae TaxID=1810 RepID=K0VAH4_MYCVA|nr:ferredoxin [Mycolicibacterium vaccae 95051]EJZ07994.1 ferredoxin [Mycolicibacterium vaccae ATCC 25954]